MLNTRGLESLKLANIPEMIRHQLAKYEYDTETYNSTRDLELRNTHIGNIENQIVGLEVTYINLLKCQHSLTSELFSTRDNLAADEKKLLGTWVLTKLLKDSQESQIQLINLFYPHLIQFRQLFEPDGLYANIFDFHQLLKDILNCIDGVIDELTENYIVDPNDRMKFILKESCAEYYSPTKLPEYYLAAHFNGRFIPFLPKAKVSIKTERMPSDLDLHVGEACSWSNIVADYGSYFFSKRVHLTSSMPQRHFDYNKKKWSYHPVGIRNARSIVEAVLNDINKLHTYLIKFSNRAFGIRIIPQTDEIEFYDPAKGLFILPHRQAFKSWFTFIILQLLTTNNSEAKIALELSVLDTQEKNAAVTIPKLQQHSREHLPGLGDKGEKLEEWEMIFYHSLLNFDSSETILDTQLEQVNLFQRLIAAEIRKLLPLNALAENVEQQGELNLEKYQRHLKRHTQQAINDKIKSLRNSFFAEVDKKIQAWEDLKERIETAPIGQGLINILDEWRVIYAKDLKEHRFQVYDDVVGNEQTSSEIFINNLIQYHEIDPLTVSVLQMILLRHLAKIIALNWSELMPYLSGGVKAENGKVPHLVAELGEILKSYAYGQKSLRTTLDAIIHKTKYKHLGFWSTVAWRSEEANQFYNILKVMNPHHPFALLETIQNLDQFAKIALRPQHVSKATNQLR